MELIFHGTKKVLATLLIIITLGMLVVPQYKIQAKEASGTNTGFTKDIIFTEYARKKYIIRERNGRSGTLWIV